MHLPFWEIEGKEQLERGSSQFPWKRLDIPAETKTFFDFKKVDGYVGIAGIDTQPVDSKKRILYYLPFYKVILVFREKEFQFFVNAANGGVYGDPIPYIPSKRIFKFFSLYITIFPTFFIFCFLFDHVLLSVSSSLVALIVFYLISYRLIDQKPSEE